MNVLIRGVVCLIMFGVSQVLMGQDLIERAQQGLSMQSTRSGASIAYLESQSLKHAGDYEVVSPFEISAESRNTGIDQYIHDHVMLDIPKGTLPRLMKSLSDGIDLRIPVGHEKEIELDLVEVFPISSSFEGRTSTGETFTLEDYPARFYRGAVKGNKNSLAAVTIADGMFRVLIADDFGNYVLAELDGSEDRFILYNDKKLKIEQNFECGTKDIPFSPIEKLDLQSQLTNPHSSRSDNCVDIMVEMEEDMYDDWNSVNLANNFIYALMNEAAAIYNNESIGISLKDVIIWTTTDPYTETDMCDQRTEFADFRMNNYNGRLAHLITSRDIGGGCAFIDELCSTYFPSGDRGPYQFSGSMSNSIVEFPTYSWNVMVFVHEMGHTFGSRHTHACVWNGDDTAIDGCETTEGSCSRPGIPSGGGTIMSYCHQQSVGINFSLGFGSQPGALIRSKVSGASCSLDCGTYNDCPRYIYLDGAVLSDTYYADLGIEIGGYVSSTEDVKLRTTGTTFLNPGFEVNHSGLFSIDQATCNAAFEGADASLPERTDIKQEASKSNLNN